MDPPQEPQSNKKKRKVTELINLWDPSKAPLPPPLEEPSPVLEQDENGEWRPMKKSKLSEMEECALNLPPPPQEEPIQSKKKLKSTNSRPKLSTISTSERRLRERQRSEAANEILTSEKSYVATLETFVNNFAYPLSASKSGILADAERSLLCNDIDMILQLNRAFLTQIVERMRLFTTKTPISDIFLSFLPHFKMYTAYCCKHAQIVEMVTRLRGENKSFKSFLKKAENHTKHRIGDFLIAPVQRVPRLALLLESLLRFTDEIHPDYEALKQALEEAQKAAAQINTKMKEVEVRTKVVQIHKSFDPMLEDFLDGPLVQPHRVFVHEGVLARKTGARAADFDDDDSWSDDDDDECDKQEDSEKGKYYCFLFNDLLLVGTSIGKGKTKRLVYETSFDLVTTFIRDDMNALCFQLVNPRCTYVWLTQSTTEAAEWKRVVEETVETLLRQHPNMRQQRSRVKVTLDDDTNEWSAEIQAVPRSHRGPQTNAIVMDAAKYREEVLENTQKHLTQFMHEHHEKLIKHKVASPSKKLVSSSGSILGGSNGSSSVFQRVRDAVTPSKKRTSMKAGTGAGTAGGISFLGDSENALNNTSSFSFAPGSPATAHHMSLSLNPSAILSSPVSMGGRAKSEKLSDLIAPEQEMDGISCINRHLELLSQELQAVREARRLARKQEAAAPLSSAMITSPNRKLTRGESMAIPAHSRIHSGSSTIHPSNSSSSSSSTASSTRQLKQAFSSKEFSKVPLQLPPSPPATVEHLSRKKSKQLKSSIINITSAPSSSPLADKRATLANPMTSRTASSPMKPSEEASLQQAPPSSITSKASSANLSTASLRRQTVVVAPTPASPVALPKRAADTDSVSTRKATPKSRKSRMSFGGESHSRLNSKMSLPPPLGLVGGSGM